jgi:maltooligosyltrehalose trehalohydrolase
VTDHDQPDHLGATPLDDGTTRFLVWAPDVEQVEVVLEESGRTATLVPGEQGYHEAVLDDVGPGTRYRLRLDGVQELRNDPASRWQPEGLHGPSAVDDPRFDWTDEGWVNPTLDRHVLYELHVGTFTPEGTFDAIIPRLADLRDLGVTAIELMPIWQFPGERNWGYDGVLPYAVQHSYGGPAGLRRLVDAAHAAGIAVVLDVVYNHFGPEGNHLSEFGPYLTDRYDTPWGQAVNVDGPLSDGVRRYFVENAVRWIREFHVDGLRLDAVHAILDQSAVHLLEQIARDVHAEAGRHGRHAFVIAESDLADPRLVRSPEVGGYGLDGQWLDDVHHALHVAFTGERTGYYEDFDGLADLERAFRDRFVMAGRWSPHRQRTVGRPAGDVPYHRFVACTQNHDQVGNRMLGERKTHLLDDEPLKAIGAALLLLPFTPMLWMGQEYGDTAPFQYFVSHTDPDLVRAVQEGRQREFAYFADQGQAPDPQSEATFVRSKLDWSLRERDGHATLLALYRELLRLRREVAPIAAPDASDAVTVVHDPDTISWRRSRGDDEIVVVVHAGDDAAEVPLPPDRRWELLLDTADPRWDGPGGVHLDGPHRLVLPGSCVVLLRTQGDAAA